LEKRDTKE